MAFRKVKTKNKLAGKRVINFSLKMQTNRYVEIIARDFPVDHESRSEVVDKAMEKYADWLYDGKIPE